MASTLGQLFVSVIRGRGLYNVEVLGRKMDPYAKIQFQGTTKRTSAAENGHKTPEWSDPPLDFSVTDSDSGKSVLILEVFEVNRMRDDAMIGCNYQFEISQYLKGPSSEEKPAFLNWVPLQTIGGKAGGEIMIKLWFKQYASSNVNSKNTGINLADLTNPSSSSAKTAVWSPPNLNLNVPPTSVPGWTSQPNPSPNHTGPISHAPSVSSAPVHRPQIPMRQSSSASNLAISASNLLPGAYPEAPPPMPYKSTGAPPGSRPLPPGPPPHVGSVYPPSQQHSPLHPAPSRPVYAPPSNPCAQTNQQWGHSQPPSNLLGVYPPAAGPISHAPSPSQFNGPHAYPPKTGSAPNIPVVAQGHGPHSGALYNNPLSIHNSSNAYTSSPFASSVAMPSASSNRIDGYPPSNISHTPSYPNSHHQQQRVPSHHTGGLHAQPASSNVYPPPNHLYPPPHQIHPSPGGAYISAPQSQSQSNLYAPMGRPVTNLPPRPYPH